MTWHRKIPGQAACGPCCGIKEKLQTLWDRTINSILRINQVEPDDQGNIRITSDSEALTVSEGTNEIILGLDTSELPAAAVLSVNGETGAVQLDGYDIPSLYNGTVNSNIAGLWGNKAARADLNTEITNRQNADTALQNNINAVQASIPQEAAAAVAADPTVLSFAAAAADIPNKVDKRTGSGLRAYTHDGSTQDDTPVIDGTTGTTIPIRDSNGRLQAADPAAGATDKTLVTANWVSQTGAGKPNNVLHDSGEETYYGIKTAMNFQRGTMQILTMDTAGSGQANKYAAIAVLPRNVNYGVREHFLFACVTRARNRPMDLFNVYINGSNANGIAPILKANTAENYEYILSQDDDNIYILIPTLGSAHDGVQCLILNSTQNYTTPAQLTSDLLFDAIPGTEIGRC